MGYDANPLEDGSLDGYLIHPVPLTSMTVAALTDFDISKKDAERAKNMFALGLLLWLYSRPLEHTESFLHSKFARKPEILRPTSPPCTPAGTTATLRTRSRSSTKWPRAAEDRHLPQRLRQPGVVLHGLVAAAHCTKLPLFLGSYPITPPATSCTS